MDSKGQAAADADGLADGRSDERERLSILEDPARRSRVFMGMARRLSQNPSQHEDLIQEAIIHAWQIMEAQPGQRQSWYLQSCFDHLRNYVRRGRSLDSARRQQSAAERDLTQDSLANERPAEDDVLASVCARDLLEQLTKSLTPLQQQTLVCLAEDMSLREISRQLNTSHTTINKHRRKIQALAMLLCSQLPGANQTRPRRAGGESPDRLGL
jgi:RNA polymerase sigma factor (sigma-70 family)